MHKLLKLQPRRPPSPPTPNTDKQPVRRLDIDATLRRYREQLDNLVGKK